MRSRRVLVLEGLGLFLADVLSVWEGVVAFGLFGCFGACDVRKQLVSSPMHCFCRKPESRVCIGVRGSYRSYLASLLETTVVGVQW